MQKAKINYFVDALMAVTFISTSIAGLILFIFIPEGVRQGRYQEFAGILKTDWIAFHNWSGIIFIVAVIIHLTLHWDWIKHMTRTIFLTSPNNKRS